jgi:hypothetical protein
LAGAGLLLKKIGDDSIRLAIFAEDSADKPASAHSSSKTFSNDGAVLGIELVLKLDTEIQ